MKETFHIFSGTPRNAKWEDAAEGLSSARERMEQLAANKAGRYFLLSIDSCSILAQTETFSHAQHVRGSDDQRSLAQQFFDELCGEMTVRSAIG